MPEHRSAADIEEELNGLTEDKERIRDRQAELQPQLAAAIERERPAYTPPLQPAKIIEQLAAMGKLDTDADIERVAADMRMDFATVSALAGH